MVGKMIYKGLCSKLEFYHYMHKPEPMRHTNFPVVLRYKQITEFRQTQRP